MINRKEDFKHIVGIKAYKEAFSYFGEKNGSTFWELNRQVQNEIEKAEIDLTKFPSIRKKARLDFPNIHSYLTFLNDFNKDLKKLTPFYSKVKKQMVNIANLKPEEGKPNPVKAYKEDDLHRSEEVRLAEYCSLMPKTYPKYSKIIKIVTKYIVNKGHDIELRQNLEGLLFKYSDILAKHVRNSGIDKNACPIDFRKDALCWIIQHKWQNVDKVGIALASSALANAGIDHIIEPNSDKSKFFIGRDHRSENYSMLGKHLTKCIKRKTIEIAKDLVAETRNRTQTDAIVVCISDVLMAIAKTWVIKSYIS